MRYILCMVRAFGAIFAMPLAMVDLEHKGHSWEGTM
jgi:hypothetical protein